MLQVKTGIVTDHNRSYCVIYSREANNWSISFWHLTLVVNEPILAQATTLSTKLSQLGWFSLLSCSYARVSRGEEMRILVSAFTERMLRVQTLTVAS